MQNGARSGVLWTKAERQPLGQALGPVLTRRAIPEGLLLWALPPFCTHLLPHAKSFLLKTASMSSLSMTDPDRLIYSSLPALSGKCMDTRWPGPQPGTSPTPGRILNGWVVRSEHGKLMTIKNRKAMLEPLILQSITG